MAAHGRHGLVQASFEEEREEAVEENGMEMDWAPHSTTRGSPPEVLVLQHGQHQRNRAVWEGQPTIQGNEDDVSAAIIYVHKPHYIYISFEVCVPTPLPLLPRAH